MQITGELNDIMRVIDNHSNLDGCYSELRDALAESFGEGEVEEA